MDVCEKAREPDRSPARIRNLERLSIECLWDKTASIGLRESAGRNFITIALMAISLHDP